MKVSTLLLSPISKAPAIELSVEVVNQQMRAVASATTIYGSVREASSAWLALSDYPSVLNVAAEVSVEAYTRLAASAGMPFTRGDRNAHAVQLDAFLAVFEN